MILSVIENGGEASKTIVVITYVAIITNGYCDGFFMDK